MSTRKTVTEVIHSELGADGTWKAKHRTVTTVTETIERDDEGYRWTPRVPRYSTTSFLDGQIGWYYPDFSARLANRTQPRKDSDGK